MASRVVEQNESSFVDRKQQVSICEKMASDSEIYDFAESLYKNFRRKFNPNTSAYAILIIDDTTFPELLGVTSANI
jgi:hypothetical protein